MKSSLKEKNIKEISKFWWIFQQGASHLAAGALRTNDLHRRQGHGEGRGVLTQHIDISTFRHVKSEISEIAWLRLVDFPVFLGKK